MADTIKERAKDLCSEISNILIHHYKGHGTEFAEAKAVEDAEELINAIRQETIDKACEWLYNEIDMGRGKSCRVFFIDAVDRIRKAMEEEQ